MLLPCASFFLRLVDYEEVEDGGRSTFNQNNDVMYTFICLSLMHLYSSSASCAYSIIWRPLQSGHISDDAEIIEIDGDFSCRALKSNHPGLADAYRCEYQAFRHAKCQDYQSSFVILSILIEPRMK